jgi:16S rRNA (guanine527-N7)-methyltransferase
VQGLTSAADKLLRSELDRLGVELASAALEQLDMLARELIAWNQRFNLTAITDPEGIALRHFADSLSVLPLLPAAPDNTPDIRIIDVGSGAGFPGLPLALARPTLRLTLLEATGKKAGFLRHMAGLLGLANVTVVNARAEEAGNRPDHREAYDVALARAVAPLPVLLELTLPFVRVGGRVIAWKKADIGDEINSSVRAVRTLGGQLGERRTLRLTGDEADRMLLVIEKVRPTPAGYPRRPGVPARTPL